MLATRIAALCLAACLAGASLDARATVLAYDFNSILQTGPLAGTAFPGTISFDNLGGLGGQQYYTLSSIDFTLLGRHFTRADIFAGGQAITQDGALSYFTAAFELLTQPSPLTTIAFGFGGPGIIGYLTTLPSGGGEGAYTLSGPVGVGEPAPLALFAAALPLLWLARRGMPRMA